jgi:hypothetical protein
MGRRMRSILWKVRLKTKFATVIRLAEWNRTGAGDKRPVFGLIPDATELFTESLCRGNLPLPQSEFPVVPLYGNGSRIVRIERERLE